MKNLRSEKNVLNFVIGLCFALCLGVLCSFDDVYAEDALLNINPTQVVSKIDKNGNPYVQMIIEESRSLSGVDYKTTVPVMFFGELVDQAKAIQPGTPIKVIANKGEYKGRISYTAISIVK